MKLFVVAAILGVAAAGRLDNTYLPPKNSFGAGSGFSGQKSGSFQSGAGSFGQTGFSQGGFEQRGQSQFGFNQGAHAQSGFNQAAQHSGNAYNAPTQQYNTRQQSSYEVNAQILKYSNDVTPEGFAYDFETSNGIRADAQGVASNGVQSQGSFGYKGDDGQDYSITYTADENGYRPQGAHLPTPPPIPEAILKSLEQNARDEAAGISDDGAYHGEGAGSYNDVYSAPAPAAQYGAPVQSYQGNQGSHGSQSGAGHAFQGHSGFQSGQSAYQGNQGGIQSRKPSFGNQGSYQGSQANQSGFQKSSGLGNAASRQYLAPAKSGSGNFNQQTGYHY